MSVIPARYFIDTEFIESGPYQPIELISIGIVCDDGRTYYAISDEWRPEKASQWVKDNVLSRLEPNKPRTSLSQIAAEVLGFVSPSLVQGQDIEFWGYYADYDWVVFCQIFGSMMHLPKGFPMYCRDLKQVIDEEIGSMAGISLPIQQGQEHNALDDARWNQQVWEFLRERDYC